MAVGRGEATRVERGRERKKGIDRKQTDKQTDRETETKCPADRPTD